MAKTSVTNTKKLSKNDAAEAISNLEHHDQQTKAMLLEMLNDGLIEIYRRFDNPTEVKVGLTDRGSKVFTNPHSF